MTGAPFGDVWDAGFWAGTASGELRVQRCAACRHAQHPGRAFCLACDSDDVAWEPASGFAVVASVVEVHLQVLPGLEPPYRVGLVDLEEGPRLLAFIDEGAEIGATVGVRFVERAGAPPLWAFSAAASGRG